MSRVGRGAVARQFWRELAWLWTVFHAGIMPDFSLGTLPVLTLPGTEILLRSHMMQTSIFVERHEYRYCTPTV